eukprot:GHVQ01004861.1.p1 GENE.GHVQ01004861.1~~GHVQ01004861.1.p1  ORF type:complete len:143 (+),score=11.83 GHVQ01004861.1:680-1108(+)
MQHGVLLTNYSNQYDTDALRSNDFTKCHHPRGMYSKSPASTTASTNCALLNNGKRLSQLSGSGCEMSQLTLDVLVNRPWDTTRKQSYVHVVSQEHMTDISQSYVQSYVHIIQNMDRLSHLRATYKQTEQQNLLEHQLTSLKA